MQVIKPTALVMKWLPDMDLNHDKQIQSLLCYRYTIRANEHRAERKEFGFRSQARAVGFAAGRAVRLPIDLNGGGTSAHP